VAQFQANDADDNEHEGKQSQLPGRIAEPENTDQERAGGANARSDGVGRADGDLSLGQPQKQAAQHHRHHRQTDIEPLEPGRLRQLEPERPANFKQAGDQQL